MSMDIARGVTSTLRCFDYRSERAYGCRSTLTAPLRR